VSVPGQREPAEQCGCEVVGVALEREAGGQQLLERGRRRGGGEAEGDCRGRRAEPALERDPVREGEPLARGIGEQRIGTDRQVGAVLGELSRALALDDDALAVGHLHLVPEIERDGGAVEARADVGRRGGRPNDHPRAAAAIASGSGSTRIGCGP
jgi:hypothetical protein